MRRAPAAALSLVFLGCFAAGSPARAEAPKRKIEDVDLFRFVWVADPQISPDGKQVAFVRVSVDAKREGYETSIWIAPAEGPGEPRRFTAGPRDAAPAWSPDSRWLAFTRSREQDGRPQPPQLHLIALAGGEALPLPELPKGAADPVFSPDGQSLAFTSTTSDADMKQKDAKGDAPRESDVRLITRAVYRANGAGYLDPERPRQLWRVAVAAAGGPPAAPPLRVTPAGEFAEGNPAWSPDGSLLYFTSNRRHEPYRATVGAALYSVPAAGGESVKLVEIEGAIGDYAISPDGRRVAFEGALSGRPARSYSQADLFVADLVPGAAARNLTAAWDFDVGAGLTGDQHPPRGGRPSGPAWSADGQAVLFVGGEHGRVNLKRVDVASGGLAAVTTGDHELVAFTAAADARRLAVVVSTPTVIGDLHVADAASGALTRLTSFNDALFAELTLTAPEEIWHPSFDGRRVHTFVQKPPDFDPAAKYPLILNIHGGPHAAYGYTFDHEFQWLAARGYVVVYPNPRGSTTYGQDFGNVIAHRYPGDDAKDLLAAVDEVIRRGSVDAAKQGVTGGSGGGVLTNWIVTQTDRFAAAVSQRSIADWAGFWYTADFALFNPTWFKAAPFEDPKDFAARSPITHVARIKTPLMLVEGEDDLRTPPADGGEQMFRALQYLKRPTAMVRFPGETHELSRSGKPWHRVERLRHIAGWFDHWMLGKKDAAYEP